MCLPVIGLVLAFAGCANGVRIRLTSIAERVKPLRVLLWLGVAIHECGHALACLLTFTRVRQMKVQWHSGFVKHDRRGWLVSAFISCGPIFSATGVALAVSSQLLGGSLAAASTPLRAPLAGGLPHWMGQAAYSLGSEIERLVTAQAYWHVPALLLLAGLLSSASPSPPDLRAAWPGLVLAAVLGVAAASLCAVTGIPLVASLQPAVREISRALALALCACLLGAAVVWPLSWLGRD